MSKAIRHQSTPIGPLQGIITNLLSGIHGLFDITLFQQLPGCLRMVSPNAGKAIGLQFHTHTQGVQLRLTGTTPHLVHPGADT